MVLRINFQLPEGLKTLDTIVKKFIPQWNNGLKPFQCQSISKILDLDNLLCITATGDGKSALFAVSVPIHKEISQNRASFPKFGVNIKSKPVGLIITLIKSLVNNIVKELMSFGVQAFAYTQENIANTHRAGINIKHTCG
ncbi:hypothetical protein Moror_9684 [Moniliophthora roreri MCA 2997]|uniref:Uncharacterized protein n=1 Tax=Moniliophthora roreri (strain MCA 2997) TaxID=1381753 RepID=V2WIN0_MONRO|nr:hypothetical protein Moror_9684 [Moniliophthora roreri MCA 2997]